MAVRGAGSRREGRIGGERRKTYIAIKSIKKEKITKRSYKVIFPGNSRIINL